MGTSQSSLLNNPIDKEEFWKERIETAGNVHHRSVYLCDRESWKYIEALHASVLKSRVSGRVLDAGCGYGRISGLIDDYTGVDFSPDFINLAKELHPGKTFIQADLKSLPFKDKEFDWAIASSIKEMFIGNGRPDDWDVIEKELKRVAKNILLLKYLHPEEYEIL